MGAEIERRKKKNKKIHDNVRLSLKTCKMNVVVSSRRLRVRCYVSLYLSTML